MPSVGCDRSSQHGKPHHLRATIARNWVDCPTAVPVKLSLAPIKNGEEATVWGIRRHAHLFFVFSRRLTIRKTPESSEKECYFRVVAIPCQISKLRGHLSWEITAGTASDFAEDVGACPSRRHFFVLKTALDDALVYPKNGQNETTRSFNSTDITTTKTGR